MIRALWFLAVVSVTAFFIVYFVERPGAVVLDLAGYRIETSFALLMAAVILIAVFTAFLYRVWIFLKRAPAQVTGAWQHKRRQQGYQALTRGMVAVSAGEPDEARRQVKRAQVLLEEPPLTMLLAAQAAQLSGDEKAAEKFFRAMSEQPETEFLGVRGLMNQAIKRGGSADVLDLARRAYRLRPTSDWAVTNLFDLQVRNGQWLDAMVTSDEMIRNKLVSAATGRRRKAVFSYQLSQEAEARGEQAEALKKLKKTHELAPGFLPAARALAEALFAAGRERSAVRVIERAWRENPHPDLVEPYWAGTEAEDTIARVKATERLAEIKPGHVENDVALARACLNAQLWGQARKYLDKLTEADGEVETRVCRMMAQLEEAEHGNMEGVHHWLTRASLGQSDPTWICNSCGNAIAEWSALCGNCKSFDSYSWRRPPHVASLPGLGEGKKSRTIPAAME